MGKRFLVVVIGLGLAVFYYLASPLLAAVQLRQAIKAGDTASVAKMVNWPSLRTSIRRNVAYNAKLLPVVEQISKRGTATWWQRMRSFFGRSMLESFIGRYITPDGLIQLYRTKIDGHERSDNARAASASTPTKAGIFPAQISRAWRRVRRAEFLTPFLFEIEMKDRHKSTRLVKSTFHLNGIGWRGLDWKLTAIEVRTVDPRKAKLARLNRF